MNAENFSLFSVYNLGIHKLTNPEDSSAEEVSEFWGLRRKHLNIQWYRRCSTPGRSEANSQQIPQEENPRNKSKRWWEWGDQHFQVSQTTSSVCKKSSPSCRKSVQVIPPCSKVAALVQWLCHLPLKWKVQVAARPGPIWSLPPSFHRNLGGKCD